MTTKYRCPFCLKKFRRPSDLSRHLLYDNCQKRARRDKQR